MKFPAFVAVDVIVSDPYRCLLSFFCHAYTVIIRGLPSSASWQDLKVSEMDIVFPFDSLYL